MGGGLGGWEMMVSIELGVQSTPVVDADVHREQLHKNSTHMDITRRHDASTYICIHQSLAYTIPQ